MVDTFLEREGGLKPTLIRLFLLNEMEGMLKAHTNTHLHTDFYIIYDFIEFTRFCYNIIYVFNFLGGVSNFSKSILFDTKKMFKTFEWKIKVH